MTPNGVDFCFLFLSKRPDQHLEWLGAGLGELLFVKISGHLDKLLCINATVPCSHTLWQIDN